MPLYGSFKTEDNQLVHITEGEQFSMHTNQRIGTALVVNTTDCKLEVVAIFGGRDIDEAKHKLYAWLYLHEYPYVELHEVAE